MIYLKMIPFKSIITIGVLWLSVLIGCEEPKDDPDEIKPPIDTTKVDTFPSLGHDGPYHANSIYYGRGNYIEYHAGNIPIILSAPHGGWKTPDEIADRTYGTTITDANTYELTKTVMDTLTAMFGGKPHVILSHLKRIKLDPNRESEEAAQGEKYALRAWEEYHHYIETAKAQVTQQFGSGLIFDMHGHGANPDGFYDLRSWLGYLLKVAELDQSDDVLNSAYYKNKTSIRSLVDSSSYSFIDVLRGNSSMGTLLDSLGFGCVPSINDPGPAGSRYFTGGYITWRHGSVDGGIISAIQVEAPKPTIRENQTTRSKFAHAMGIAVGIYYERHLRRSLKR
jgi:N-formylglutamate amidohydrolase